VVGSGKDWDLQCSSCEVVEGRGSIPDEVVGMGAEVVEEGSNWFEGIVVEYRPGMAGNCTHCE
jgi:hypothetical protein